MAEVAQKCLRRSLVKKKIDGLKLLLMWPSRKEYRSQRSKEEKKRAEEKEKRRSEGGEEKSEAIRYQRARLGDESEQVLVGLGLLVVLFRLPRAQDARPTCAYSRRARGNYGTTSPSYS